MKKTRAVLFFLLLCVFPSAHAMAEAGGTKGVVATIKPLHSLVTGVMGETGRATLLLTGDASPHGFQLKPSQMKALQEAAIIFYIDERLESFLHHALETLPGHVRKAATAQNADLTILTSRTGGAWEESHAEHGHHAEDAHHHHDHSRDDMHVWLDPGNAKKMVTFIRKELSAVFPENRETYQANAQKLMEKIDTMDIRLRQKLAGLEDAPFIVFHDAYQYLERRYGLRAVGAITHDPDALLSPRRLKEARGKLQKEGVRCVFREPQFPDRFAHTVLEGTEARIGTLDPLGTGLPTGETLYFTLLENMANSLSQCLRGQ